MVSPSPESPLDAPLDGFVVPDEFLNTMLRWFFDANSASPLELLSVVSPETFSAVPTEADLREDKTTKTQQLFPPVAGDDDAAEAVLRWRRVVLSLSDEFSRAAKRYPHLAPIFMEAMGNLLEQLLLFGREEDVVALDEWLNFRPPTN